VTPSLTPTYTPTNVPGRIPTATLEPTQPGGASSSTPLPSSSGAGSPGIPVTGEGPGLREIGVMLLAGLGIGIITIGSAVSLARRGRRVR
jgi:hypothetical protein